MRAAVPAIVLAVSSLLLTGCQAADVAERPASNATVSSSPTASAAPVAVLSAPPAPLTDLECADFAGVAKIGTIAGVAEREPSAVVAEILDVVPLADIVRNAGGLACEFSDGGAWRAATADGSQEFNTKWRGAAIFVVPNVGAAAGDLVADSECGDPIGTLFSVCQVDFAAGGAWVTVVSSTNDKGQTFRAVRDHVKAIVGAATSRPGPITRAEGTFEPPRDCASLVPTPDVAAVLGGSDLTIERPIQLQVAAEATFTTENTGCEWYRDNGDSIAQLQVLPGGGWAADHTLSHLTVQPVVLGGLSEGAVSHCTEVAAYDYWVCAVEVVIDGTWLRGIGVGPTEAKSTAIAVALAEGALAHRN